ncbi:unnamed protein product [Acanthoscelides obtectus]|uniref:DNA-directed DNA polymerase n=1 Tax=Acanthoscelides obtectus TaxID=200917 RepID=A0A9P0QCZ5_ACAOB|nr:unnamed protein product [Acanthoscelides obtectus]CAK1652138.1 hypothetical protein AOBTE_LOCUS17708 [Acanthoscelides obtectus]
MNNKLMFVNCQKCGEDFVREECQHSIQERSLKGTWVIEEALKAIEKGYQIIETYEIWEYDTIQLSKDQEGLFSGMMNKFLQIKQQASGWPKHCLTDEEKNRYIDAFLDREDIKLEFSKIIENPCLRSLAKLMLNSFWGKFAQKENQNKTSIVRDCGEFFDMLTNPSIHVNTVLPVNEETLLITWEFREEAYDVSSTVNVVLASYVTALARLKLYSFLEKVEERAVYVDTDSCIYISRKGLDDISTGDFIGDMTDELNGGFISEFVSGGPKNYAYKYTTLSGEEQIVKNVLQPLCRRCQDLLNARFYRTRTYITPVLPSKMNNKLMFVNCQKCGEDFVREECQHSIQERSLKGTWVIEEVLKAIEKGYQIIETYEIWEYDTIQLSKDQEGLFSGMMNKFLQIKQQASGWPKHCLTDEEKNRYIDAFLDREDIKLEFSKIIENPCLRSLAKLMLNSFWGKFAQKENQNKTSIVRDCGEFFDMLTNPSIHVNTVLPVNEETLLITWEFREEAYDVSSTVNVVLASYVTALARLKLYSFLEKVEERAVYVDTDSCIYISRKGLDDISTGDFIGDMTDELNGGFISEFVSGGPKNYAYKYTTLSGEEQIVCKVKGISLNYKASQVVNFEKIKDMVLKKSDPVSVLSRQLRRTREHAVVTVEFPKVYKITSMKRKFYEDHTSVPFGFKKIKY